MICKECKSEMKPVRDTMISTCDNCDYTIFTGELGVTSSALQRQQQKFKKLGGYLKKSEGQ